MHKLIALYAQPADASQFRDHLEKVHLPLVSKFPHLRAMRHGFDVANPAGPSYYAVVECEFETEASMKAALASPQGEAAAADVPNYASAGVTILTFAVAPQLDCEIFPGVQ
ncbi:EthD family reductase (plasmid) [Agrobacterium fabrum]|uniref:EthD family reductase n=1 Tax=Agrobacterium fabrum TaxID=1176649 RepID=UPI0021D24EA7|nr:EthD family reductase [Agrobacterium fabrum]UXT61254.1 EthD family reductase [Agrobacterium fabrum]